VKPETIAAICETVLAAGREHGAEIDEVTILGPDRSDEIHDSDLVFAPERKGQIYATDHWPNKHDSRDT
jgi:hypothetical protein